MVQCRFVQSALQGAACQGHGHTLAVQIAACQQVQSSHAQHALQLQPIKGAEHISQQCLPMGRHTIFGSDGCIDAPQKRSAAPRNVHCRVHCRVQPLKGDWHTLRLVSANGQGIQVQQ